MVFQRAFFHVLEFGQGLLGNVSPLHLFVGGQDTVFGVAFDQVVYPRHEGVRAVGRQEGKHARHVEAFHLCALIAFLRIGVHVSHHGERCVGLPVDEAFGGGQFHRLDLENTPSGAVARVHTQQDSGQPEDRTDAQAVQGVLYVFLFEQEVRTDPYHEHTGRDETG